MIHHLEAARPTYARIRALILSGRLAPGAPLEPERLSTLVESTDPARIDDALRLLLDEGLVIRSAGSMVVRRWSREEVIDLFAIRGMLEVHAARLCAERARPEQVKAIRAAAERFERTLDDGDVPDNIAADVELHLAIADGAGVPGMSRLIGEQVAFRGSMNMFCLSIDAPRLMAVTVRGCHDALVAAIEARDPDRAAEAAQGHVDVALARCLGRPY